MEDGTLFERCLEQLSRLEHDPQKLIHEATILAALIDNQSLSHTHLEKMQSLGITSKDIFDIHERLVRLQSIVTINKMNV